MRIKAINASEIVQAQEIAKRVIFHNYAPFLGVVAATEFVESGQSDKEIIEGAQGCFVLEDDECLVGFTIIKDNLLHLLMIDVPYQQRGYGTKLLNYAETIMFHRHSVIHLQTFEENIPARSFYEKNGWRVVSKVIDAGSSMLQLTKDRALSGTDLLT